MDVLIKNATVINAVDSRFADVLIKENKIAAIDKNIKAEPECVVIDASGKYLIPGGIDPHVHLDLPTPAGPSSDDFVTGSKAAITGGTTALIDFVTPRRGQSLVEALKLRIQETEKSLIPCKLHVSPVEWRSSTASEIEECIRMGFRSFKVYMAYRRTIGLSPADLENVMNTVKKLGGIVTAHCEMGDEIEIRRDRFASEGKISPLYHALSRSEEVEWEAVKIAVDLAEKTGCPFYIVHVSSAKSLEYIKAGKEKGLPVFAETCPHYLLLDDSLYNAPFEKSVKYIISPPLRKREDNNALWDALGSGLISTVATDHCPFNLLQKSAGKDDFRLVPNGAGGAEHRLALLFTYGVLTHRINLNQWVDISSTQAAKIFGMFPQKGQIAVGSDADLVIWNPETENVISAEKHVSRCDLEIFEGYKTRGSAETVILAGKVIYDKGMFVK